MEYEFAGTKLTVQPCETSAAGFQVVHLDGKEARSYLTSTGLLFAAISDEAPTFEQFFPNLLPLLERVDFTKLPHRRTLKYGGAFNWKTMVCTTTHLIS